MFKSLANKLFCSHRHDVDHHPMCFSTGNVDQNQAKALYEKIGRPWYQVEGLKIGYLDIESDGLKVDFATMLSWCIKEKDGSVAYDVITKEELFDGRTDQRIVASCISEMLKYKIIVTYYGTIFDMTFLRAKALHYDMYFPSYISEEKELKNGEVKVVTLPELYHFDLFYTAKSKLASLSRKSLDNVCDYLNIKGKTPLDKETWRVAKYGDKDALGKVLEHNIGDVEILEQLHNKLTPFVRFTRKGV